MKYLMLVCLLAVGYGVYTYGSDVTAIYERVHTQVEALVGQSKVPAPKTRQGPLVIPGQPLPVATAQNPVSAPTGTMAEQTSMGMPPAVASAAPSATAEAFKNRVAAAQRAAIQKYPALGQANSEMNSRFLFRYKNLVADKSPRLQDANWPLSLADECAAAVAESKAKTKPVPASSQKGTLAAAPAPAH